ncbi:MAG: tRNA uridine-5-carboxymethylaminomethyl(34) synthesis GTPase MnmE [Gammaproteobacteria bacterium]
MSTDETIVAVSTPPGRGGIGIVRVSGQEAFAISKIICKTPPSKVRHATLSAFIDNSGSKIDTGIVLYYEGPHSYTGEDLVEIQAHGNPLILDELVRAFCCHQARIARPGEFTERAFRNNKIDLSQAEAVADVINSQTIRAVKSAQRSMSGEFGAIVQQLIQQIQMTRAELEAAIDFSDEVVSNDVLKEQKNKNKCLISALVKLEKRSLLGARLTEGLKVVIAGAPNAGKSSLLNKLADSDRSIVSDIPGTTRDTVEFDTNIEGVPVRICDTAGIHESNDVIEKEGIRRTIQILDTADIIIHLMGAGVSEPYVGEEIGLKAPVGGKTVRVFNKIDQYPEVKLKYASQEQTPVFVSALTGEGIDDLRRAILSASDTAETSENEITARSRHVVALKKALVHLRSISQDSFLKSPELVSENYRNAIQALDVISGRYSTEDMLGDIFSKFCIGK